jgi:hypothetical protein
MAREKNAMPTMLPDRAARTREQRRQLLLELAPVVAVMLYLLLLAWNMATFEANFGVPRAIEQQDGAYNPMERGHRATTSPHPMPARVSTAQSS